jgi:hypothetical protein
MDARLPRSNSLNHREFSPVRVKEQYVAFQRHRVFGWGEMWLEAPPNILLTFPEFREYNFF